jgi:hypothetical protein
MKIVALIFATMLLANATYTDLTTEPEFSEKSYRMNLPSGSALALKLPVIYPEDDAVRNEANYEWEVGTDGCIINTKMPGSKLAEDGFDHFILSCYENCFDSSECTPCCEVGTSHNVTFSQRQFVKPFPGDSPYKPEQRFLTINLVD